MCTCCDDTYPPPPPPYILYAWFMVPHNLVSRAPKGFTRLLILSSVCVCACLFVCVCARGISPINTWPIIMKLRMEIGQRSRSPKTWKITVWAIAFEPEVVEISGWFYNVPDRNTYPKYFGPHDVPFLLHVTSNKTYDFCMFSKFDNFVPIDLKIGTHIDWTYIMHHTKECTNQTNVTRVSMATKYPIIKHRRFSKPLPRPYHPFTWRILMQLRMEIPVLHVYFVWQPI